MTRYSEETRQENTSKYMDFCYLREIYPPNMRKCLQKQD